MFTIRRFLLVISLIAALSCPAACKRKTAHRQPKTATKKENMPTCSSAVPEMERIDCAEDVEVATVGICRSRDCVWCQTSTPDVPYCFFDNSSSVAYIEFLKRQCQSCSYCPYPKDCHPEIGVTEKKCIARGCQWCNYTTDISCGPTCLYGAVNNLVLTRLQCETCSTCTTHVDCHPESGADHGRCLARGCRWCDNSGIAGAPVCVFSDMPNFITEARTLCNTCSSCQARIDCHPEPNPTSTSCLSRNCIWCPTNEANQPYCVYGGPTPVSQNTCQNCNTCNTKMSCPPNVENPTQLQCETYGCMWCPFKSFGDVRCVHRLA